MTLNRLKAKVSVKRKKIPIIDVHFIRFKENTSSVLIRACVNMVFISNVYSRAIYMYMYTRIHH